MPLRWQDTWAGLFDEVDAAKEKAKADFLEALGNPPILPLAKVIPLADAMTKAQWRALLNHIGPVSSDSSVTIDVATVNGVLKLDLRAMSSWEKVTIDPSTAGLARGMFTLVWQTDGGTPPKPLKLWAKYDTGLYDWSLVWPIDASKAFGGYAKAYEVDYTVQTAQNFGSNATATIDNKLYTLENNNAANLFWGVDSNGIRARSSVTSQFHVSLGASTEYRQAPIFTIPLLNLLPAGHALCEFREIWLWWHIGDAGEEDLSNASDYHNGFCFGVETIPMAPPSAGLHAPQSRVMMVQNTYGSNVNWILRHEGMARGAYYDVDLGLYQNASDAVEPYLIGSTENVIAMRILEGGFGVETFLARLGTGSFLPDRASLRPFGRTILGEAQMVAGWRAGGQTMQATSQPEIAGLRLVVGAPNGVGVARNFILKKMRIEYVPAAANIVTVVGGGGAGASESVVDATIGAGGNVSDVIGNARTVRVAGAGPLNGLNAEGLHDLVSITIVRKSGEGDLTIANLGTTSYTPIHGPANATGNISLVVPEAQEIRLRLHLTGTGAPFWQYVGGSI